MHNIFALSLLMALVAGVLPAGVDKYCSLCDWAASHIACNNDGQWKASCPANARLVEIDDALIEVLVAAHNKYRNFIAGGRDARLRPACRMATIEWDDELAYLAELNVRKCEIEHDDCHDTERFPYSGQNLGWLGQSTAFDRDFTAALLSNVDMWYEERDNVVQDYIDAYPGDYQGPAIGHFTALMLEKNVRVGCAASTYSEYGWHHLLAACNYASTNIIDQPVYTACDRPAEDCQTGTNADYPNLCSKQEQYDFNDL